MPMFWTMAGIVHSGPAKGVLAADEERVLALAGAEAWHDGPTRR